MSQLLPNDPECPENCQTELPEVDFSRCNPVTNPAQISYLYVTNVGNSMTDWTSAPEWAGRISNTSANADAIRQMFVIGSKPKPESTKIQISLGRTIIGKKKHTVNFKIDETNATNRELVRLLECGGQYLIWFETSGGILFGDNSGIIASIESDIIIDEDSGQIMRIEGTISWESKFTPASIASPIAQS